MAGRSSPSGADLPRTVNLLLFAVAIVGVGLVAWAQVAVRADSGYLFDYYPLYRGAQALVETGDAYGLPKMSVGGAAAVGNAYPIHAVLLLGLPLSWLPPATAVIAWTLGIGLAWILAVRWAGESPYWFLWIPMWQALLIQQPAAGLGVAAIAAFGALQRRSPWVLAICIVVLSVKPQQFLLLCALLAWWGRTWWRQMAIVWVSVAIVSFAVQPDWVQRWLERVEVRADFVPVTWFGWLLVPLGILLAARGWRASGAAIASSGLGPWPTVGGYYAASAWPQRAGRSLAAAFALLGILGFVAGEAVGASWPFVVVLAAGIAMMSCNAPRNADATAFDGQKTLEEPFVAPARGEGSES